MRIAAWNLNHRARLKAIPEGVVAAIKDVRPDTLVLTEYVDGDSRDAFKRELKQLGLEHCCVSERQAGHNQVLIASNRPHETSGLAHPGDRHAATNFLAVHFPADEMILIGVRAPAYESSAEVKRYWEELTTLLETHARERIILIGDLNANPEIPRFAGGKSLQHLRSSGWQIPSATGEWSYMSPRGLGARIDHVAASPPIGSISASYVTDVAKPTMDRKAISDHAILVCEVAA